MSHMEVPRRDTRRTFVAALLVGVVSTVMIAALLPTPSGAHGKATHVHGKVNLADTDGDALESEPIADMGILQAEGSSGALAVRTFGGGTGFGGAADCDASTTPPAGPLPNFVEVSNAIVTAILMTGDGTVTVTSQAVGGGQVPLLNLEVNANNPNEAITLGNGLTVTTPLRFEGSGGPCNFVVLVQ